MMNYNEMVEKIQKAKDDYYQNGRSELTDTEYDRLVAQAEKLGYIETVGAAPVDHIDKVEHNHLMLSLDKCHTVDEIIKFVGKNPVVAMYKADGLTVSATYTDGILTRLETRGNGVVGNDIMFHANSICNLPKHIDVDGTYIIDGECVILQDDFDVINSTITESERYSNPRNLAAGSLNSLDNNESKKRCLRFYAWDVIEGGDGDTLADNLIKSELFGFDTVRWELLECPSRKSLEDVLESFKQSSKDNFFPIDGVVLKFNDIAYGKSLGKTEKFFRNAIAYKYKDDTYPTKLGEIIWQVGRTSQITPVAVFDPPVTIDATIIEKASVHNISMIKNLGLTNGCTCYVKKCNMIIPQIDSVDQDGYGEIEIPSVCPECGHPTRIDKSGNSEVLYCTNDNCPAVLVGLWKTFTSDKGMDVDGLSEYTLERFLKLGYLTNMFISLYELKNYRKELYKLDGFGKKSIDNILKAIEKSKDVSLANFICAFSIPGVGVTQSKILAKEFHTFDDFTAACDDQFLFSSLNGFGPIVEHNIHNWWMLNSVQMTDVAAVVNIKNEYDNPAVIDSPLDGITCVVTGSVNLFKNRAELQSAIEAAGGKVVGSVSKNTDYLINNDTESNSSKNVKAKSLGVKIISEQDFVDLFLKSSKSYKIS